jgi:putative ABC transport system ATP-binding protein
MPSEAMRPPLVRLINIAKNYIIETLETVALNDINLEVISGSYLAISGPSGSGKSTLLNIIGLLDKPSTGRYELDGVDISECDTDKLADFRLETIGFVFQRFNLLPRMTIIDNVALPLAYKRNGLNGDAAEMAFQMLQRVGLDGREYHYPSQLSGGQQQRVAIARALINNPLFLLADEPTGALDSQTGREILNIFDELNSNGITIIMISHDVTVVSRAREKMFIVDGKISHMT